MTNKPQKVKTQKKTPVKDRETLGFFWLSFVPGPGTTPNGPALYPWLKGHRNYLYLGYLTGFSGSLLVEFYSSSERAGTLKTFEVCSPCKHNTRLTTEPFVAVSIINQSSLTKTITILDLPGWGKVGTAPGKGGGGNGSLCKSPE